MAIISAGTWHTAAIKNDGTLWTWGHNEWGQLGDGTTIQCSVPVQENTKANDWKTVYAGVSHTAAIKNDGTLWTWGGNYFGQLGDETTTHRNIPVQENTKANNWKEVCAGYQYTAAIKDDGTLWTWGYNNFGQLGDGTTKRRNIPVQENTKANNWKAVSARYQYTAAIKDNGTLWAWGNNEYGQLGNGTTKRQNIHIQENTKANDWKEVCAGAYHTTAIKNDGTLWAWGHNSSGQLGDGTTTQRNIPVQENTKTNDWKKVCAGAYHTAAIKNDGTLWVWGHNLNNQLGDGTTTHQNIPVQENTKANNWKAISAGYRH
ncbi:MAG: hypothetical protein FWG92_04675, partial [Leptospirales bacterium]|nr:hypothetical protein [Leptospirales bacterium]